MSAIAEPAKRFDVVGFGIAAVDDIVELEHFPEPDSKMPILSIERHGGGQSTTALVAAARQGMVCGYAGLLGANELSEFTRTLLRREGIQVVGGARYPEAQPYHSIVLLDASTGERTVLFSSDGVRGPAARDISEELIAASRFVLVDQLGPEGTLKACRCARESGTLVIADFERADDDRVHEAMLYVDHLIVPLRFALDLTGRNDPAQAAAELAKSGRACTAVTDGKHGCWFVTGGRGVVHQASFEVRVVDTTGCGDVFHGAYAAAIVMGMPPPGAIEYASAAAALKVTRRGAQAGIPNQAAVRAFLEQRRNSPCSAAVLP